MPLSDQETTALDIIAKYNFLTECHEKGYIAKEKYDEIVFGFGPKNLEMINYYIERLDDHFKDTSAYMDNLKPGSIPDTFEGIADKIVQELSPEERKNLSNLPEEALKPIQMASGLYSKEQIDKMHDDEDSKLKNMWLIVKNVWVRLWKLDLNGNVR